MKFNIREFDPEGKVTLQEIEGRRIPMSRWIKLFSHKCIHDSHQWDVSEFRSGMSVARSCSNRKAQEIAIKNIKRIGMKQIQRLIQQAVDTYGEANEK